MLCKPSSSSWKLLIHRQQQRLCQTLQMAAGFMLQLLSHHLQRRER